MADFLFVLCKENVNRLIKYTGYGNAAGLLASRGLMGNVQPQSSGDYSSDDEDSETEEYAMDKSQIDPMIGEENLTENSCLQQMTTCFNFEAQHVLILWGCEFQDFIPLVLRH